MIGNTTVPPSRRPLMKAGTEQKHGLAGNGPRDVMIGTVLPYYYYCPVSTDRDGRTGQIYGGPLRATGRSPREGFARDVVFVDRLLARFAAFFFAGLPTYSDPREFEVCGLIRWVFAGFDRFFCGRLSLLSSVSARMWECEYTFNALVLSANCFDFYAKVCPSRYVHVMYFLFFLDPFPRGLENCAFLSLSVSIALPLPLSLSP
jgi:hypothetical protein